MAPWGAAKLFSIILFITCYCTVTLAHRPIDCCLTVKNKEIGKSVFVDYRHQVRGQGCVLEATILLTRGGKNLCVPADETWVQEVIKHVDSLKTHCKAWNYKGKRCTGVRHE